MSNIAIVGGGIAGLTAAWQLHQLGQEFTLYEASGRLGGTVETVHRDGFTIELGPDGWVSEKPWANELARDLGLEEALIPSNDADRVTYILHHSLLTAMPDGMRMMVPTNLGALTNSPLFSDSAREAYASELQRAEQLRGSAPTEDESVASFVLRHFGLEVLEKLAAPLLSGVFGGDVSTLSVKAVMPAFVQMEREHGSLIQALQNKGASAKHSIFTTFATGTQTLIDRMAAALPESAIQRDSPVQSVTYYGTMWHLELDRSHKSSEILILATPAHVTRRLLSGVVPQAAELLDLEATSAVIAAFAFDDYFHIPKGFGFLVPFTEGSPLLAVTFIDQKFPHRAPPGKRLLRAFFGGTEALHIAALTDEAIAELALAELRKILGPLPAPAFHLVRRLPRSLPQYAVGHLERMAELAALTPRNLHLLGNAYHGVGLPDLIRDSRALARSLSG